MSWAEGCSACSSASGDRSLRLCNRPTVCVGFEALFRVQLSEVKWLQWSGLISGTGFTKTNLRFQAAPSPGRSQVTEGAPGGQGAPKQP